MERGYIPNRQQLMIRLQLRPLAASAATLATLTEAIALWWGGDLSFMATPSPHPTLSAIGHCHNLLLQEAGAPVFDAAFIDQQSVDGVDILWLPTHQHLPQAMHQYSVRQVLVGLREHTTAPELAAFLGNTAGRLRQHYFRCVLPPSDASIAILAAMHDLEVDILPIAGDVIQLGQGSNGHLLHASSVEQNSVIGATISEMKYLSFQRLKMAGIPTPETYPTQTTDQAEQIASSIKGPMIVKPEAGNRGEGVHTHLVSVAELTDAIALAIDASKISIALVQPQLKGQCHRLQVMNERVVRATTRFPKSVVGNGLDTVKELVMRANKQLETMVERRRLKEFPLDTQTQRALSLQGADEHTVIAKGQRIVLRTVTSVRDGGAAEDIIDVLHPANVTIAIEAAKACHLACAGVDFFSEDPSVPWYENGGMILEVNVKPQIVSRPSDRLNPARDGLLIDGLRQQANKIAIHLFVGSTEAERLARNQQAALIAAGQLAWCVTADGIFTPEGSTRPLHKDGLAATVLTCFGNPRVDALCLVVGEWGQHLALPINHMTSLQTRDVLMLGPPHPRWHGVLTRLQAVPLIDPTASTHAMSR